MLTFVCADYDPDLTKDDFVSQDDSVPSLVQKSYRVCALTTCYSLSEDGRANN